QECERFDRDGTDWSAAIQRALREVRQFEQTAWMGPCARDRKSAGKKTGLPAVALGPVRRCARDRAIAVAARPEDRHRAADESGIGSAGCGWVVSGGGAFNKV